MLTSRRGPQGSGRTLGGASDSCFNFADPVREIVAANEGVGECVQLGKRILAASALKCYRHGRAGGHSLCVVCVSINGVLGCRIVIGLGNGTPMCSCLFGGCLILHARIIYMYIILYTL